ncbi:MAG: ROK family protein [Candidatus Omnitrophota bacterium]
MAARFIIAIDLGGTNLKIGLLDLKYRIQYKGILSTRSLRNKEGLIRAIVYTVRGILKEKHLKKGDILGLGLGLPGPIDTAAGIVHFFPNIPGWKEVRLKGLLEKRLGIKAFLDNDANLMGLAEYKLGAAQNTRYAVCITLGTGVGGGLILDGKVYRGRDNATGEIGHIPVNEKGPRCNCGGIACLETYVGNNRIRQEVKRLFKRDIPLEELSLLARRKNRKAMRIWQDVGGHLGIALVGIVNLLNPECVVIGGGVAGAGEILFKKIKEVVFKQAMVTQARGLRILRAKLGNDSGLIGAAILVREAGQV